MKTFSDKNLSAPRNGDARLSVRFLPTGIALTCAVLLAACGESGTAPGNLTASQTRISESGAEPGTITARGVDFSKLAAMCGEQMSNETLTCDTPSAGDGLEMACNPHLAQSAWSGSHRNNYAQASSPLPGITGKAENMNISHADQNGASIVLNFSDPDSKGRRAVWSSTVGLQSTVYKVDQDTLAMLGSISTPVSTNGSVSGAYNLLDRSQNFIVGRSQSLQVFGDSEKDNRHSGIALLKDFSIPQDKLCGSDDALVGITMLPDGHIAFATKNGVVGVVPRYTKAMCAATLKTISLNGSKCGASGPLEQVSNSIAADENSNIYVVTSDAQYRIDWNGLELKTAWRAPYQGAGNTGAGRLGGGSGSTPTLMGTREGDDRFVVITDGAKLVNVVYMWRDEIPAGWKPIREGADRRIACEVPINFGDPNATETLSEQSVLVRGYGAVVVNNQLRANPLLAQLPSQLQPYTQLTSGMMGNRPTGLQRVDWNPATRTCKSTWTNRDISWPNGIPTMSASTNQIFGIGSRTINGVDMWTLESVDFTTGKTLFVVPSTPYPSDNSFYAATTIGPGASVWTGTLYGVTKFESCDPASGKMCGQRANNPVTHLPRQAAIGR